MFGSSSLWLMRLTAIMCVAALLSACGSKAPDELLASARQNLERGQGQAAIIELKNVLQAVPESAPARFLLGKALLGMGDAAGAAIELERALAQGHAEEEVLPLLAQALLADKKSLELIRRLQETRLPSAEPDANLRALVGEALFAQKRFDEAQTASAAARARVPEHRPSLRLQAKLLVAERKPQAAVELLERMAATDPADALTLRLLGDFTLQSSGNRDQALATYDRSLKADPQSIETYESIMTLHLLKPDIDAARQALAAAKVALPNQPRLRYFEAQLAFADGNYAAVVELIKPLLQRAPEDINLMRLAGAAELKMGSLQKAEQLLGDALARAPAVLELRRLLAETQLRSGQPAKALQVLAPSIDASSLDHEALGIAGQATLMLGDSASAVRYFERAARLRPQDPVAAASLALARAAKGDAKGGIEELRRIAAADKGTAVDLALVSGLIQRQDYAAALQAVDVLERKQPDSALAPNLRGRILARRQDLAGARSSFELALKREPGLLTAVQGLAEIDVAQGKASVARERYAALVEKDSTNMPLRLAMADFVARNGGTSLEVAKLLASAVAADPTAEKPRLALVSLHLERGDTAEALSTAQAGVAALPDSGDLLGLLGQAQVNAGDLRTAAQSFTLLAQKRADQAEPLLALADVQIASGDLDGADRSVRRALEISPQSVDALRSQANLALKQKRHDVALAAARSVQRLLADAAVGLVMEGDVEMARGAFDAAAAVYLKATARAAPGASPSRLHWALMRGKKEQEAAQFADAWAAKHPADTAFVLYLADHALATGKLAVAEQRYRQLLAKVPEQAMALNNLAWVLVQQKKPGALEVARRAVRQAPENPSMQDTLALALAGEGQYAEALQVQSKLLQAFPARHEYRLNLARILVQSGDKARARQELDALQGLGDAFAGQAEVRRLQERARSG
jgi:putative PEP-CTERM system TPR-repeat lipoprotein